MVININWMFRFQFHSTYFKLTQTKYFKDIWTTFSRLQRWGFFPPPPQARVADESSSAISSWIRWCDNRRPLSPPRFSWTVSPADTSCSYLAGCCGLDSPNSDFFVFCLVPLDEILTSLKSAIKLPLPSARPWFHYLSLAVSLSSEL